MAKNKTNWNNYLIDCAYRKKSGYCTRLDNKCNPYSFKCAKQVKAYTAPVMAVAPNSQSKSKRVVNRSSSGYNPFNVEYYGINTEVKTLNRMNEIPTLHVFKGYLNVDKKNTIDYKMLVRDIKTGKCNTILVAYNTKKDKYYLSSNQLNYLHKKNCFLRVVLHPSNDGSIPLDTFDFNEFSIMALYGYHVGKGGLKAADRRQIIRHILDNKILKGYQMISHLQSNIALREGRIDRDFTQAINDWKQDIIFINNYVMEELENSTNSFWWKH